MVAHERAKKTRTIEGSASHKAAKFSNGNDIHAFLCSQVQPVSVEGLKALRNQLTLKSGEETVAGSDERLTLVKEWLETSPGAQDVFSLIENQNQPAITATGLSILTCILSLTSVHFVHQSLGHPIVKRILTSQWMKKIDAYLSGAHHDLNLATLKLLIAISAFAGGKEQKTLMESFSWDVKLFHKLLYMRRKGKDSGDMLLRPDIRTLALQFILSFLSSSSPSHVKTALLEQHRDVFLSNFKGVSADPYSVIRFVLETLWTNLWQDQKVKRTLKVGVFGETTIQHLLKIYDRREAEGADPEKVPADVVHHFLLAICSHRGLGICFADNGWYPRQEEDITHDVDETDRRSRGKSGKIFNKILANVLKMLKVNEDPRQQELALKILSACPELVAGYLPSSGLTLEPRLSSKWLANIAFLGSIVSLPIPADSFLLPLGTATSSLVPQYQPKPPPLWPIIENILPSLNLKVHLTKALQSTSVLVQHSAAITLAKCLQKCESVLEVFGKIEQALGEDEISGQWAKRRQEVEKEVRRRVPDFQVVIAFSNANAMPSVDEKASSRSRAALMAEIAQRLMLLYHRCCPSLVAEARYDIGKSLSVLDIDLKVEGMSEEVEGLRRLHQLHVINMLRESDQFVWQTKTSSATHSNIFVLLNLFINTTYRATQHAVMSLLTRTLRDSLLFQHDPGELTLWLEALPRSIRGSDAETPDGAKLTDERHSVLVYLDDCFQRCGKTPYRYLESLAILADPLSSSSDAEADGYLSTQGRAVNASPLLATCLEQIGAKMKAHLLSPSDALALTTYIRKITVALIGKQTDMVLCEGVLATLMRILCDQDAFPSYPIINGALRKEVSHLKDCIDCCGSPIQSSDEAVNGATSPSIIEFLEQVEQVATPEEGLAKAQAYELIDWLRVVDKPLRKTEIQRLMNAIRRFYPPVLLEIFEYISPKSRQLLNCFISPDNFGAVSSLSLLYPLLWTPPQQTEASVPYETIKQVLRQQKSDLYTFKIYCGLLLHRFDHSNDSIIVHVLRLLTMIVQNARDGLLHADFATLKQYLFRDRAELRTLFCQAHRSAFLKILQCFLDTVFCPDSESDQNLVDPICKHWIETTRASLSAGHVNIPSDIGIWVRCMSIENILVIFELVLQSILESPQKTIVVEALDLMGKLLKVIVTLDTETVIGWLNQQLPRLMSLRQRLPSPLEALEHVIAHSLASTMPLGYDGLSSQWDSRSLSSIVDLAERHWKQRHFTAPHDITFRSIAGRGSWSADDCKALSTLIYRSVEAQSAFWGWLCNPDSRTSNLDLILFSLYACLDSCDSDKIVMDSLKAEHLVKLSGVYVNILFEDGSGPGHVQIAELLSCIVDRIKPYRARVIETLQDRAKKLHVDTMHPAFLTLACRVRKVCPEGAGFVTTMTNHALHWAARRLSEEGAVTGFEKAILDELDSFIANSEQIAPHFAEPVLVAVIRNYLLHPTVVRLAKSLFVHTKLKPANVNRLLQSILQHVHLTRIADTEAKDAVLELISSLFHSHPHNTCQPSHIQALMQLYSGSLSTSDQLILSIMHLYESERKASVSSLLMAWSRSGYSNQQTFFDVICSLEPGRVLRTVLCFPHRRSLSMDGGVSTQVTEEEDRVLYDPVLLLLLLAHVLAENSSLSALSWIQVYRTNIVSLLIRCLSAVDPELRLLALLQLSALKKVMQDADMQEKGQVLYVLNLLRDQLLSNTDNPPRLPSYMTLFLAHALRGIFYPSNFIYPITARFLLQRPELDLNDVPLLYGLLYSSSNDWKKERAWIIRFLADGMQGSEDWRLLKRRHTWDLLASLFESSNNDKPLRHGILEVLANLTCHPLATSSLILKSSLVQWIEMQLLSLKGEDCVGWAKIIENLLVVVDAEKIERTTRSEWKAGLLRCIKMLLPGSDIRLLRLLTRSMARVAGGSTSGLVGLSSTLDVAMERLADAERILDCSMHDWTRDTGSSILPPHRSHDLHRLNFQSDLNSWGCIVEDLWKVSMSCESKCLGWDRLTPRLLVWRATVGERNSPAGEWARRQTLSMLLHQS